MASSHTMPGLFPPGRPIQRQCPAERCVCINSQAPTSLRTWCSTPTQLSSENPRCFLVSDEVFIFLPGSLSVQLMIYCFTFFFKYILSLVYAMTWQVQKCYNQQHLPTNWKILKWWIKLNFKSHECSMHSLASVSSELEFLRGVMWKKRTRGDGGRGGEFAPQIIT